MLRSLLIAALALGASCSTPLRETAEPSQPVEQQPEAKPVAVAPPTPHVVDDPPVMAPVPAEPVIEEPASPEPPVAARKPAPVDPVKELFAEEERRIEREKTIASLTAERDAAALAVMRREKDLLAMKNPFLPRPQLSAAEQAELKGLGGAARAKWGEAQIAEAKALLEAAEKALAEAKAKP